MVKISLTGSWNIWQSERSEKLSLHHRRGVTWFPDTVCFFTHTDWFYAVNPFCSSLNCCFRLQITVHRLAVLLTVFWRKKRAKSVSAEKWKAEEYRSYLFRVSMKLQIHNTWITLAKKVKCCKSFFLALESRFAPLQNVSCACKFNLHLQSYVHLHNSYPSHANLLGINLPSYPRINKPYPRISNPCAQIL